MRTQHQTNAKPPTLPGPGDEDRRGAVVGLHPAPRPRRLLAAEDVAQVLGVRATFVYALARRGELPTVRVGERYVRFRTEALLQWIEQQESSRPKGSR